MVALSRLLWEIVCGGKVLGLLLLLFPGSSWSSYKNQLAFLTVKFASFELLMADLLNASFDTCYFPLGIHWSNHVKTSCFNSHAHILLYKRIKSPTSLFEKPRGFKQNKQNANKTREKERDKRQRETNREIEREREKERWGARERGERGREGEMEREREREWERGKEKEKEWRERERKRERVERERESVITRERERE